MARLCNNHKYNLIEARDSVSGAMVPLFHPRRDRWADHFEWDSTFARIIGTTPVGRATVDQLRLNRPSLQNLRIVLRSVGQHPPNRRSE
jgi:hypothetical protein